MQLIIAIIISGSFIADQQKSGSDLLNSGYDLFTKGAYDSALVVLDAIIDNEDYNHDLLLVGNAHYSQAMIYKAQSSMKTARSSINMAKSLAEQLSANVLLANCLQLEGQILKSQGHLTSAVKSYEEAKELYISEKRPVLVGIILSEMGNIEVELERYRRGVEDHRESVGYYQAAGDSNLLGLGLSNQAHAQARMSNYKEAIPNFYQAIDLKKTHSSKSSLAYTYQYLGQAYADMNEIDSALSYLELASGIKLSLRELPGMAETSNLLADLWIQQGQLSVARLYLDSAYQWGQLAEGRSLIIRNLELQRTWYRANGEFENAMEIDDRYDVLRDSLFQDEKLKVQELQASFDLQQANDRTLKAEQQRAIQQKNARSSLILALVLGVFFITTVGFLLAIYRQRKRVGALNRTLEEKNEKIRMLNRQNFHFTKNSLMEVVGLINMQANKLEPGVVKDSIVAERLRMESVNLLYRRLFASAEDAQEHVDLDDLLQEIISNTLSSLLPNSTVIDRQIDIESVSIQNDKALSLALITNEICINACKYAFRDRPDGVFRLSIRFTGQKLHLELGDDGPGLHSSIDFQTAPSFGMQLIRLLAQDLRSEVSLKSSENGLLYQFALNI